MRKKGTIPPTVTPSTGLFFFAILLSCLPAIDFSGELDKQPQQRQRVNKDPPDGHALTLVFKAAPRGGSKVEYTKDLPSDELCDLELGEILLEGRIEAHGRGGVVEVHDGMDQ